MLRLQPKLAGMRVFGTDLEKYVFKPFSNLFPTAIHLLCDLNIKDNIQNKLQDLQFQNRDIKKGLVDSRNAEEFDGCYEERWRKWMAFKGKGEKLISYLENGNIQMIKDCMRDEIRSVSGLGFPPKPYTQCQRKCQ